LWSVDWLVEGERDNAGNSGVCHVQTFQDVSTLAQRSHHETSVLVRSTAFSPTKQRINSVNYVQWRTPDFILGCINFKVYF